MYNFCSSVVLSFPFSCFIFKNTVKEDDILKKFYFHIFTVYTGIVKIDELSRNFKKFTRSQPPDYEKVVSGIPSLYVYGYALS
jgi:predicted secreted protein